MIALSAASVAAAKTAPPPSSEGGEGNPQQPIDLTLIEDDVFFKEARRRIADGQIDDGELDKVVDLLSESMETVEIEDSGAFAEAVAWWKRGDRREALHHLEIALGRDWYGLEDILK